MALFQDRSMASADEHGRVHVHDLLTAAAANRLGTRVVSVHRALVDQYRAENEGEWTSGVTADRDYYFRNLAFHLREAELNDELSLLLSDVGWIQAKLTATEPQSLLDDYALGPDGTLYRCLREALALSAGVLSEDAHQLASQLHGRLGEQADAAMEQVLSSAAHGVTGPWLRPLRASLSSPGGLVQRFLWIPNEGEQANVISGSAEAALASDGSTVARLVHHRAGDSVEQRLYIWDLAALTEPRSVRPPVHVGHFCLSNHGGEVVTASGSGDLTMFDSYSGEISVRHRITLNPTSLSISSQSGTVVVGDAQGNVTAWRQDWTAPQMIQVFVGQSVLDLALAAGGSFAFVLSNEGTLARVGLLRHLGDTSGNSYARTFASDPGAFTTCLAPDESYLLSGGHDQRLRVWKVGPEAEGLPPMVLPEQPSRISRVISITPDRILVLLEHGILRSLNADTFELEGEVNLLPKVNGFAAVPSGTAVARVDSRRLAVLDLARIPPPSAESAIDADLGPDLITCCAVDAAGLVVYFGSRFGAVYSIELRPDSTPAAPRREIQTQPWLDERKSMMAFKGTWSGDIEVLDVRREPYEVVTDRLTWPEIMCIAVDSNGRRIAWVTADRSIVVFDTQGGAPVAVTWAGGEPVALITISEDGRVAATGKWGELRMGSAPGMQWREEDYDRDPGDRINCSAWAFPDTHVIALDDASLKVRHAQVTQSLPARGRVEVLSVAPGGLLILSAEREGSVAFWHWNDGRYTRTEPPMQPTHGRPTVAALSPDSLHAVVGYETGELNLYSTIDHSVVATFYCDAEVEDAAVSNGATIIVVVDILGNQHLLELRK